VLAHLQRQTFPPHEVVIASSGLHPQQLLPLRSILIGGTPVPVVTCNSPKPLTSGGVRNFAGEHATGNIVQFLDGDDLPHPQRTEFTYRCFMTSPGCPVLLHGYDLHQDVLNSPLEFSADKIFPSQWCKENDHIMSDSAVGLAAGPIAIQKRLLQEVSYNPQLKHSEDKEFLRELFIRGYTPLVYGASLMCYLPANTNGRAKSCVTVGYDMSKPFPYH